MHKASMRKSETFEQTVHRQEQNRMRMASMRESAAPRVWHFSAFHLKSLNDVLRVGQDYVNCCPNGHLGHDYIIIVLMVI